MKTTLPAECGTAIPASFIFLSLARPNKATRRFVKTTGLGIPVRKSIISFHKKRILLTCSVYQPLVFREKKMLLPVVSEVWQIINGSSTAFFHLLVEGYRVTKTLRSSQSTRGGTMQCLTEARFRTYFRTGDSSSKEPSHNNAEHMQLSTREMRPSDLTHSDKQSICESLQK